ncbi:hypothetical protein [Croceicoccus sp. BE223]|uniref:hypothetical protein n=1 Tax=Croceicoccus sp. BE223 TaxID=2817716 RepID=UPI002866BA61|nr:hypothetical protein [Croceicoccus sp. BE223]MDR7102871.1 hypothetical protein [Croceicoccus sp. BE223]
MKTLLISTAIAALAVTTPAHAQVLGGGGLGGMIGGTLNSQGSLGGTLSAPTRTVGSATRGTADASTKTKGSKSIDSRSGSVATNGSSEAGINGTVAQATRGPLGSNAATGSASGSGSGSGSANANAQLIGTDQVRTTVSSAAGTAGQKIAHARRTANGAVSVATTGGASATGVLKGSADSMAGMTAGLTSAQLAAAGSAAAQANGAIAVARGTPVSDPSGDTLGTVRQVVSDARGQLEQVLVDVDGMSALLPADNFSASGNVLISAMSEGEIRHVAEQQAPEQQAGEQQVEEPAAQ